MKFSLVLLLACVAFVASSVIPVRHEKKVVTDKHLLERQKQILVLFTRIHHDLQLPEYVEISKTWKMEEHVDKWNDEHVVHEFLEWYHNDILGQREIFSVFNERHLQQAIALFKVFYYAKDYDTFYKTAVWARQYLNRPMWVYSFTIAVTHRPDTKQIVLPPIHEIEPHYFFPSEAIHEAQYYKQVHDEDRMDKTDKQYHGYTIASNYSGHYLNLHPEQSLSYFMEDVGLNSMYYYIEMLFPSWMKTGEYGMEFENRGAVHYFTLQQILARYYLERVGNKLGEIPVLDLEEPIETPFTPSLTYSNGLPFPNRPRFVKLHEYFYNYGQKTSRMYRHSYEFLQDIERRIAEVADSGIAYDEEGHPWKLDRKTQKGLNTLANIIEGNADSLSLSYYGNYQWYFRHLLGYAQQPFDQHRLVPSAVEHYETTLRDPITYQAMKKVFDYYTRYYRHLTPYTKKDLTFHGVHITDVEVEKLITYMDNYYSDLTNAVFYNPHESVQDFNVRVRQHRLNHKHFSYKLHVKSDKSQKVVVKAFLGPKYDEYDRFMNLTQNYQNFVEMDHYVWDLKSGENVIERNCRQFGWYAPDRTPGRKLYESVTKALERNEEFHVDNIHDNIKWPMSSMLPKGTEEGTTYQMFFFVYPWTEHTHTDDHAHPFYLTDAQPFGYPLDRGVKFDSTFDVPNSWYHEVKIYHETNSETHYSKL